MKLLQKNNLIKNLLLCVSIFIIIFLNIYPTIHVKLNTPKDKFFLGQTSWFDPWDINLYVATIHSGQTNGILLPNSYTTTPNKPILMYPLYTTLGTIFKTINPFFLFHAASAAFGVIFVLGVFYLLKFFIDNFFARIIALLGICLGGGLGWFIYPNVQSADLIITSFTPQSTFQRAHEAAGLLAYLTALTFFYLLATQQLFKRKTLILAVLFLLISLAFYPYYILSFTAIAAIFLFIKNKGALKFSFYNKLFFFLIPAFFLVLFLYNQISQNPTFVGVLSQNLPLPNLTLLLLGYGVLVPLFIYQLFFVKKEIKFTFLNVWIITSIIFAYLPLGISRFFLRGLFFPLVILGIMAITSIGKRINFSRNFLLIIFLIIIVPSTLRITYARLTASDNNTTWYYISKDEYKGLEFLNKNTESKSGAAALYKFGNLIPAYTKNAVYFGHLLQTPNALEKLEKLYSFYAYQMTEKDGQNFLSENNIKYVVWGKDEKELSRTYPKKSIEINSYYRFLIPIFSNNNISIFATM